VAASRTSPRGERSAVSPDGQPRAQQTAKRAKNARPGVALDPDQSYRVALKRLIAERWRVVWQTFPKALAGEGIGGVHDVRVASRRLRAAMDVAVSCFDDERYRDLHKTAKAITSSLGEVRDRDVLIESLTKERDAAPPLERPGLDRMIERIETERRAARVEMETYLSQLLESDVPAETRRRFGRSATKDDTDAASHGSSPAADPSTAAAP